MKIKKHLYIILFFTISLTFCTSKVSKESLIELSAGVHAWPGGGPIYLAQEKGFFTKHGIKVNIKKIENFDTKRAALIGGDIDLDIANTMDQLLIYANNSFPIEIIGVTDESIGGDGLVAKSDILTIQDLKGKSIAFAEASPSDFFLRYILKQNNIGLDEVILKPVADPQIAGNAIISKTVDAGVTYEPFLTQAKDTEGLDMLVSTKEYPTLIPGLILANKQNVNKDKTAYQGFIDAWFEAVDYYYSNREESEIIIADGMGIDLSEVKDILSTIELQSRKQNIKLIDDSTSDNLYELIKNIAIFWEKSGFIDEKIDEASLISQSLIKGNYEDSKAD